MTIVLIFLWFCLGIRALGGTFRTRAAEEEEAFCHTVGSGNISHCRNWIYELNWWFFNSLFFVRPHSHFSQMFRGIYRTFVGCVRIYFSLWWFGEITNRLLWSWLLCEFINLTIYKILFALISVDKFVAWWVCFNYHSVSVLWMHFFLNAVLQKKNKRCYIFTGSAPTASCCLATNVIKVFLYCFFSLVNYLPPFLFK